MGKGLRKLGTLGGMMAGLALSSCSRSGNIEQKPSYRNYLFVKEGALYFHAEDYAPIGYASVTLPGGEIIKLHGEGREEGRASLETKVTDQLLEGEYSTKVVNENGDTRIREYKLSVKIEEKKREKSAWYAPAF